MKLNIVLPWVLVLGLSAGLAAVYVKGAAKDAELATLREQTAEVEQLRADLADAQDKARLKDDEVVASRKDKEELIRLRGEVGKLRDENQKFSKDIKSVQSRAETARAQADDALRKAEAARAEATLALTSARPPSADPKRDACINNLRQLDGAKQQWALENNKTAQAVPAAQDIAPYLKDNTLPKCPAGGDYTLNSLEQVPTCSIPGHTLGE